MHANVRITAGSIDQDGNTVWGTGDFYSQLVAPGIYDVFVDGLDSMLSSVTCSLNNKFKGQEMNNLIKFSKDGDNVQFRIQSLDDGRPDVRGSFDFIIVSPL